MGRLLKLIDSTLFVVFRGGAMLVLAGLLTVTAVHGVVFGPSLDAQVPLTANDVAMEHRFTKLETQQGNILRDIETLKEHDWMKLLALAGLVGEMGFRNIKSKGKKGEADA